MEKRKKETRGLGEASAAPRTSHGILGVFCVCTFMVKIRSFTGTRGTRSVEYTVYALP
jgi:hypothetical protein